VADGGSLKAKGDYTVPESNTPDENRSVPLIDPAEWEPVTPDVTEEELDRRAVSTEKRYTTAEVIAYLESL